MPPHRPGPSTCGRQDTESTYSSRTTYQFPFTLLPPELRLSILELYALPKGPIFYGDYLFWDWHLPTPLWEAYKETMPEFWSLRQVNRETRRVVLRGRQGVRLRYGSIFVDWERDAFAITRSSTVYTRPGIPPNGYRNFRWLVLSLWDSLDIPTDGSLHDMIANMPALRGLYLIVYREALRCFLPPLRIVSGYLRDELGSYGRMCYASASVETVLPLLSKDWLCHELRVKACEEFLQHVNRAKDNMQSFVSTASGRTIECKTVISIPIRMARNISGPFITASSIAQYLRPIL
ncbi:hypothetical protein O1611_g8372 [Lasiodiplodia mahajangana]|uniref:Uncharacterized protein n=1 Tax=Lasiodiplodia mahajangana TaxID=1108764 RepID=A0ACC2JCT4_9PEZI|nr:hypothetical protein O1611_g8372 [Lasiodiplodia mahajangana]